MKLFIDSLHVEIIQPVTLECPNVEVAISSTTAAELEVAPALRCYLKLQQYPI